MLKQCAGAMGGSQLPEFFYKKALEGHSKGFRQNGLTPCRFVRDSFFHELDLSGVKTRIFVVSPHIEKAREPVTLEHFS